MFWRYQKNTLWHVQPMRINAGNVVINTLAPQIVLPLSQECDIVNDQAAIIILLNYITVNPQQ